MLGELETDEQRGSNGETSWEIELMARGRELMSWCRPHRTMEAGGQTQGSEACAVEQRGPEWATMGKALTFGQWRDV